MFKCTVCKLLLCARSWDITSTQHITACTFLSHFVTNKSFCHVSDDERTHKVVRSRRKNIAEDPFVTFHQWHVRAMFMQIVGEPLILLLTSTKTKQFAWNDWWVLIFWEQQSQQMTVRILKLSYLFIFDKPHSYRKLSNIKWDTNVFVRRRDRRRETVEWLAARLCTRAQWVTLPRHDDVPHCHLLSAQSSSRAFLGYGSSSLQSHCGSLVKSRLCLVSATYGI